MSRESLEKCRFPSCPEPANPDTNLIGVCLEHWGQVPQPMQRLITATANSLGGRVPRDLQLGAIASIPAEEN